jgi:pilus assembly protein FimV
MGGINVASALGQPLKADIQLMAVNKAEKESLVARLASPDAYKSAGLEYPYGNKFKFEIDIRAGGEPYIKVSSAQAINDPFVSLLVELSWSAGKLSREYTFLLDPVGYVPVQPEQAAVQAVAPAVQTAPLAEISAASAVPAVPVPEEQVAPLPAITPEEQGAASAVPAVPAESTAAPVERTVPEASPAKSVEQAPASEAAAAPVPVPEIKEFLAVKKGDTMYKIAAQSKQADMSLERMLVALYRANADQFDGRNMNRIRAGKILHLPSQDEYASVTQEESVKEIHAQATDWNAYRQKLASAAAISGQPQVAQQVASGKISSSVADKTPVAKESAKEVLKLSKGEAPGDKTATGAGGKSISAQDKKNAAQEDAIAKAKAAKEGQMRIAKLEEIRKDKEHLAQLQSEAAALAQPPATVASAVAASAPEPAKTEEASAAKPKPKEVKPEQPLWQTLLDQLLSEPLYLAGAVAALLVVVGLGFMVHRRKKKRFDDLGDEAGDVGSTTGKFAMPVVPSPDTGDFTQTTVTQAVASPQSENVDPISEADLFLNFGRDVQAEEILKEALQNTPNNHQIHLKLLGIYANRKDANSFSTIAGKLQNSGDDDAWQQAAAMGRKLDPSNPMYGGGGGFRSMEDTGSATMQVKAFNAMPEPENAPPAQASALDFDFDAGSPAAKASSSQVDQDAAMDFDITSTNPEMPAAAGSTVVPAMGDMVFDITGSHESKPAVQQVAEKPADDGGMAFTLDFPTDNIVKPAPAAASAGIGLAGINLNFDDVAAAPGEPATGDKDDHWQEVATKLDLAKAYQEMGDNDGAREILEEVMREGDAGQRDAAQALFDQLIG